MDASRREQDMAEWPLIEIEDTLWHVGFMDPARKGTGSLEGHGLSVSRDPYDWRRIARLSGEDWILEKPGHSFLDVHELSAEQRATIYDWAVEQGLCERTEVFLSVRYDDEWETEIASTHATYEQAVKEQGWEIDGNGAVLDDEGAPVDAETLAEAICKEDSLAATKACIEMMKGYGDQCLGDRAKQYAIIAYAEQVLGLDGLWWEDEYNPVLYRAPRGVIFPDKLASWKVIPKAEYEEREETVLGL